jgi:lipopolysaccharide export system protein LptA
MVKHFLTYVMTLFCLSVLSQNNDVAKKSKIEILSADELIYNQEVGRYQLCRGNVRFKQGSMLMDCDSARFYEDVNKIEAFGDIYIRQRDTLDLWGKYLEYDGDTRLAKVSKDVRLTDGKMTLTTDQLNYNMVDKVGFYTTGGNIINGEDRLYSKRGTYFSRSKEFFFKDSVQLANPDYTMESDTLKYNTKSKVATFLGPTYIRSEENTIYCQYGWYNTEKETSQFSKGAYIEGESNKLTADSMMYHRTTGFGEAFGNISMIDTSEKVAIYGDYGRYQRLEKSTMITGSPRAIKDMDGDSLYFRADTFIDLADTLEGKKRRLIAYRSVKLYKSDMQAVSDSMEYNFTDSTIGFYTNPILWADSNQITGDTILVFRNKDGIERLKAYRNGYVIERDANRLYNQIKGKHLEAFFINGKIYKVDVDGNGQSVYYALEDSAKYSGVNDVICGMMTINIDTGNRIRTIVFKNKPKAAFYPIEKFPENKSRLQGFKWYSALRPEKFIFLN